MTRLGLRGVELYCKGEPTLGSLTSPFPGLRSRELPEAMDPKGRGRGHGVIGR